MERHENAMADSQLEEWLESLGDKDADAIARVLHLKRCDKQPSAGGSGGQG